MKTRRPMSGTDTDVNGEAAGAGDPSLSFGRGLQRRRKEYGYTQEELAQKAGCSTVMIQRIEEGVRRPSRQLAELIAAALEIEPGERATFVQLSRMLPIKGSPSEWRGPGNGGRGATSESNEGAKQRVAMATVGGAISYKEVEATPHNLPRQVTSLVGREREVEAVCALLRKEEVALVTLTGPGGIGKTRLALQVGAELVNVERFRDGVCFVELAPLTDHKLVASTIANILGVKENSAQSLVETLKAYLQAKQLVLVLDNFEHVVQAAPLLDDLMKSSPAIKVLVTSRNSLKVYGEKEYSVPPLAVPDVRHGHSSASTLPVLPSLPVLMQYEAVRLFIERARDVKRDFEVNNDNAPAVAEICVRLDGLPLAIELAAARLKLFSPTALLTRLTGSLSGMGGMSGGAGGRLKLLTGGARTLHARQQTLRATIEWSYELLDEGEKQLFRRMAVFQGGRTLEALEAVCNGGVGSQRSGTGSGRNEPPADSRFLTPLQMDVLEGVESLVSRSLLQQREDRDGEPRFWMLETINEYAREKLQESGEARALAKEHAHYFMRLAEEAEPSLMEVKQIEALNMVDAEYDNIRAALQWAYEEAQAGAGSKEALDAGAIGLRTAGAIGSFWFFKGLFTEGREHLTRALCITHAVLQGCSASSRAKAMNRAGGLAVRQGDYSSARTLLEEALSVGREANDKKSVSFSLLNLGNVVYDQGDYARARPLYEEALALCREIGDKRGITFSLNNLGVVAYAQEDYARARALHSETLALRREMGDKWGIAYSLDNLAKVAKEQGDYPTARALCEESPALRGEMGDKYGIAYSLMSLGVVAYEQEDYARARALYEESLTLGREMGDKKGIAISLAGLGGVKVGAGQADSGARLLGAVEGLLQTIGAVLDREDRPPYERGVQQARAQLGDGAFQRAWAGGRTMSMERAIEYALTETR